MLAKMKANGLSDRTRQDAFTILRKMLADAVRTGALGRNVADRVERPRAQKPEMHTWTAGELRAFLAHVESDRLSALWHVAATTGMRRGEVLGLRWSTLTSTPAGSRSVARPSRSSTRSSRARRSRARLGQSPSTRPRSRYSALTGLGRIRKCSASDPPTSGDLVFACEDGTPIHPDRLSKMYAHVRRAGVPRIRMHDLRHTHATLALAAGVHPKVVQERLGHANIAITKDTYSHVIPALAEEAAARIAAATFGS